MDPIAVTTENAASILGVSRASVYNLVNDRKLEKIKIAGRALITVRSLKALAAEALGEEAA